MTSRMFFVDVLFFYVLDYRSYEVDFKMVIWESNVVFLAIAADVLFLVIGRFVAVAVVGGL